MSPRCRICRACGQTVDEQVVYRGRCPNCRGDDFYASREWRRLRAIVRARDRTCQARDRYGEPCTSTDRLTVHHRVARVDGGADHPDNLTLLCLAHHNSASGRRG